MLLLALNASPLNASPLKASIPDHSEFVQALRSLASRYTGRATLNEYGRSATGQPLLAISIVPPQQTAPQREILVVAGLEGNQPAGALAALALARQLLAKPDFIADVRVTIIPRANPDGLSFWSRSPLAPIPGNGVPVDEDRDWLLDEDPPNDLDGDGRILEMRARDPQGTLIPDPVEPRLLRSAKPEKGERGLYVKLTEGIDDDADGRINEDGPGGAGPAMNFPHAFAEYQDSAGRYPLEAPSARALASYLLAHPKIALVVVLSHFDSVTQPLDSGPAPKGFPRKPAAKIQTADKDFLERLAEEFCEALEIKRKKGKAASFPAGDFTGYCYFHLGVAAISHPLWTTPPGPEEKPDEDSKEPTKESEKKPKLDPSLEEQAKWLAYADANPDLGGYQPWHSVPHPKYGTVEIGGFVPGFREIPPEADLGRLAAGLAQFVKRASEMLPRVRIEQLQDEARGAGVYRIEAVISNRGELPLVMGQGLTSRHVRNALVTLAGKVELVTGTLTQRLPTLLPGKSQHFEWWVTGTQGTPVTLRVESVLAGSAERRIHLGVRREEF